MRSVGGKLQQAAGRLLGDAELEADGVANEIKGEAKVDANRAGKR